MSDENWTGAVDTEDGRAWHRTCGGRAWTEGGWCYPSDPCSWCREHLGETQVWLPPVDGDGDLVGRIWRRARLVDGPWLYASDIRAVLAYLREEAQ